MTIKPISLFILATLLGGCAVGPDYVRPSVDIPAAYKESRDWKIAEPRDNELGQHWWAVYNDPLLNQLITQIDISNQNLAQAEAQYRQATALIQSARAAYFPTIGAAASATRSSSNTTPDVKNLSLNASWEADVWGRVRRTVEANEASAQASAADLRAARLSAQAALAQNYWQLRIVDAQKDLLTDTVTAYQRSLQLTQNQYAVGVAAKADLIQAQTQLRAAQAQLIDLGVLRAQTEHAIALLIGQPATSFSITPVPYTATVPAIPATLPSALLERRPDISAAERRMAAANAQIGIAKSAYYPTLSLSGSGGYQSSSLADLITAPSRIWSIGPALALNLFDGGLRKSQTAQAIAGYDASVAAYKQTVLTGFQEVEDNLAALRILENEAQVQDQTVQSAKLAVTLVLNQYKAGMVSYSNVVTVQATLLSAENSALSIANRRMAASVKLAAALGGDWQ
jgi:NodT family efflux transporter outer membrane factor (OMF) lipoprotein